jgi:hypothetical protein
MSKLKLRPEELEVQSFETRAAMEEPRGTVRAHAETPGWAECYSGAGPCGGEPTRYEPGWGCDSWDVAACPDTGPVS